MLFPNVSVGGFFLALYIVAVFFLFFPFLCLGPFLLWLVFFFFLYMAQNYIALRSVFDELNAIIGVKNEKRLYLD